MKIILCLDDNNGMLFNKRRQSRDSKLRAKMLELTVGHGYKLWMNDYSAEQFDDKTNLHIYNDISEIGDDDYCFVENIPFSFIYESKVTEIVIYRWNRKYPSDVFFDFNLKENGFHKISTIDFPGFSHDKITEEIYIKK